MMRSALLHPLRQRKAHHSLPDIPREPQRAGDEGQGGPPAFARCPALSGMPAAELSVLIGRADRVPHIVRSVSLAPRAATPGTPPSRPSGPHPQGLNPALQFALLGLSQIRFHLPPTPIIEKIRETLKNNRNTIANHRKPLQE